jgi:hypothetical protein
LDGQVQRPPSSQRHAERVLTPLQLFAKDIALSNSIATEQVYLRRTELETNPQPDAGVAARTEADAGAGARATLAVLHAVEERTVDLCGDGHR